MKRILLKILFILIILAMVIYLYGRYLNTSGLVIHEIPVYNSALNPDYNGLKIAHISDIHYGRTIHEDELKNIIVQTNELKPDIIIFTGDLSDNKNINAEEETILTNAFQELEAKLFKFAIIGDYDESYLETYKNILKNSNFVLLENQNQLVYYNSNSPLNIIGLSDTTNIKDLYSTDYFNITIMHKPDLIKNIPQTNLAFAGHSLGGQYKIPFIGGIKKIDGANTYIDSYYKVNDSDLYISSGIGTQDLSIRLFNKPSLNLYRLYNS